jgi:hypothetical protein
MQYAQAARFTTNKGNHRPMTAVFSRGNRPSGGFRFRRLVLTTLVVLAVLVALVLEFSSVVRNQIHRSLMRRTADQAETEMRRELDRLFEPIQSQLEVTGRWGERGALVLTNHPELNRLFIPMLEQFPQVSGMIIADETGLEYFLLRKDGLWFTRSMNVAERPEFAIWRQWANEDSVVREWEDEPEYDPRDRPWYQAAMEGKNQDERGICWTELYRFFTTEQIGITLSKRWKTRGEGGLGHVTGLDVSLEDILAFAGEPLSDRGGHTFVLSHEGGIIDVPDTVDVFGEPVPTRPPSPLESDALAVWQAKGSPLERQLSFSRNRERWWFDLRSLSTDSAPPYLAVVVPEASFAGEVSTQRHLLVLIVAGTLLLAALLVFLLTQSPPSVALTAGGGSLVEPTEGGLRRLIETGETDTVEFKATLRWNINSDKPGKEVEISWLKTVVAYLNSGGGVLIIGVGDDGEIAGIEADRFPSEDKFQLHFNNLVKQHIGVEFARHIHSYVRAVEERRVFVVECEPASEPVFLKLGKEERFYVRVGPSSRQLSMSEVVKRFRKPLP